MRTVSLVPYGNYRVCFLAGIGGAAIMTILLAVMGAVNLPTYSISMLLGSMLTFELGFGTWTLGFIIHLLLGGLFGLAYAALFRGLKRTGAGTGMAVGAVHWVVAGIFMGILPVIHPLIPDLIFAPGLFALNLGLVPAIALLITHLIFGSVVGAADRRFGAQLLVRSGSIDEEPPYKHAA